MHIADSRWPSRGCRGKLLRLLGHGVCRPCVRHPRGPARGAARCTRDRHPGSPGGIRPGDAAGACLLRRRIYPDTAPASMTPPPTSRLRAPCTRTGPNLREGLTCMGDTVTWPSADGAADSVTTVQTPPRSLPAAFSAGAGVGVLVGLIGLGGAEFPAAAADRAVPVPRSPSPPGWPRCPNRHLHRLLVRGREPSRRQPDRRMDLAPPRPRGCAQSPCTAVLLVLIAVALAWDRATRRLRWPRPYALTGALTPVRTEANLERRLERRQYA